MTLPLVLTSLLLFFLLLTCVSSQYEFHLDNKFSNDIQEPSELFSQPSNGVPAYYAIPPQDLRATGTRGIGALTTIIYFVEIYNKLQHVATAVIQPFILSSKPKPALAPASTAVVVGAVPTSQGSSPATSTAPGRNLSPEKIPAGYIPLRFFTVPDELSLV